MRSRRSRRGRGGALRVWRLLLISQIREQPARPIISVLAIAIGVALASAIFLVNGAALAQFTRAARQLVGESDVIVRGPPDGFPETLFPTLARDPAVAVASPVLEIDAAIPGRREPLEVLGMDPFRAAEIQPAMIAGLGPGVLDLLRPDGIFLSAAAAADLRVRRGDTLPVIVGDAPRRLVVQGVLPAALYAQPLGIMDIASAQWTFGRIGRLNRIDLRLGAGEDPQAFRRQLQKVLPAGVYAIAPSVERSRAVTATRAYRVNLNMLALVALWTGAFLVFSTQSLSVLRRRNSLALLRALGVTRAQLERALTAEGAVWGAVGGALGLGLGALIAALMLRLLSGDLGNGQLRVVGATLRGQPLALCALFAIGVFVAALGAWVPARAAARRPPARALKGGDEDNASRTASAFRLGIAVCLGGIGLAWLPPIAHLPVFGYAAVAALLFGAVLLVPALTVRLLRAAPHSGSVVLDTAIAQLRDNVALSTLSLASIIVSFSLMVAMAIMVYSFRVSFENWLTQLLPADIQLRVPIGAGSSYWSAGDQSRIAAVPGIARIEFRRTRRVLLSAAHVPVTLIARDMTRAAAASVLPIVRSARGGTPRGGTPRGARPAWISEAVADLYGYRPGDSLELPLAGGMHRFVVAGVWRDYARSAGSIVVERADYLAASGDSTATEGAIWLAPAADAAAVVAAVRKCFARPDSLEILASSEVRRHSLQIFDRAFAITYAMEAIAVLIGLAGVGFAASSTALARRAEFGMLRHIGMLRGQVIRLLADEGIVLSTLGVIYGLTLGVVLSLVLVYVVNRQSFHWSIDLSVPFWQLAALGAVLIAAAAGTSVWSGRAAVSEDAVRAVREDW